MSSRSPSRRHQVLARLLPRLRGSGGLDSEDAERARLQSAHAGDRGGLPSRLVPRFSARFDVVTETLPNGAPAYVLTPRDRTPRRTLVHVHGGGYVAPIDPFHVRYAARLARALDARVVLPTYPLAPEHTWADSHGDLADLVARWAGEGEVLLSGDSAGGGLALALALTLRDRGGPQPARLLLLSPWVDLTTSTPETPDFAARDPWLDLDKLRAYAGWWAGSVADLGRPEVSPALGDLDGLPPALVFCGTRDTLAPGCRLLASRAAASTWDLTYVEVEDLIHVFALLPFIPEARTAWQQTLSFLSGRGLAGRAAA